LVRSRKRERVHPTRHSYLFELADWLSEYLPNDGMKNSSLFDSSCIGTASDAGVHMGFPRDKATTLVYHTMLGSTLYAMETGEHPAILRNSVTSPSGTTASALYELENGRFRTVIKDAMWACYRRSLEMGNHDSNVGPGRYTTPEPRITLATDSDEESGDEVPGGGTSNARIIISTDSSNQRK
jgi:hypothetical protein